MARVRKVINKTTTTKQQTNKNKKKKNLYQAFEFAGNFGLSFLVEKLCEI